tara:strand:- start:355 stop:573 length:219 start_codon:yes stop_codon:yes gene_type:complete
MQTDWNYIIYASGTFLTEHLPEQSVNWEDEKLNKFLKDHAWEPFEYYDADQIWEQITILAHNLQNDFILKKT